jgi:hypothetical protein
MELYTLSIFSSYARAALISTRILVLILIQVMNDRVSSLAYGLDNQQQHASL